MILAELALGTPLWANLKMGQRIRKVLSLVQSNSSVLERIAREHNCYEIYQVIDRELRDLIEECLVVTPKERPTAKELLQRSIFNDFKLSKKMSKSKVCSPFEVFTIHEFYHWWQLAGGDVYVELKKQGLIRSSPPVLSLPK